MKIISASAKIIKPHIDSEENIVYAREDAYTDIERAARNCYQSTNGDPDKQEQFIRKLVCRRHFAMLEHASVTVEFIVDRGISHEIVRHRLASFAQESTRYCNYASDKHNNEITVIAPCYLRKGSPSYSYWLSACAKAEEYYLELIKQGETPERARAVLPTSTKTTVTVTTNMTEWRHFFKVRAVGVTGKPHPQMREVAVPLLHEFARIWPAIFDDIEKELEE